MQATQTSTPNRSTLALIVSLVALAVAIASFFHGRHSEGGQIPDGAQDVTLGTVRVKRLFVVSDGGKNVIGLASGQMKDGTTLAGIVVGDVATRHIGLTWRDDNSTTLTVGDSPPEEDGRFPRVEINSSADSGAAVSVWGPKETAEQAHAHIDNREFAIYNGLRNRVATLQVGKDDGGLVGTFDSAGNSTFIK